MSPLQALYERARQEWAASANDTIPNPLAPLGPRLGMDIPAEAHYNPARDVPVVGGLINRTVNGPLHALGLVNEGAGNVAQGIGGGAMLLAALAQVKAADAGLVDPNNTATQAARLALAQGFGHPGRALAAAREGPDTPTALLAGGLEMAANPLNYAGPAAAARAARLADPAAAQVPRAVAGVQNVAAALDAMNRLGGLPLGITKGGRARLLPEIFGAAKAPAADAGGAVARLLADAPVETSGGVPLAGLDLPLAPGRRNYNAVAKLAGLPPVDYVKPEASPLAPQNFSVLRAARALARDEPAAVPAAVPDLPATPEVGPSGPTWTQYGPETIHPGEGVTPELLDQFAKLRQFPNPSTLDVNAEIGALRDPVTLLQQTYGDQWQNRLAALTGGKWGQPGSGATLVNGRVMLGDLDLTAPLRDYLENRGGPQAGEFKGALKALLPEQGLPTPAATVPSPSAPPAAPAGTLDDVRALILDHARQFNTRYPPLDPAFYAKRANVDPAQVPAMLDQLVQEGTLGRLPDGSLGIKPAAGAAGRPAIVATDSAGKVSSQVFLDQPLQIDDAFRAPTEPLPSTDPAVRTAPPVTRPQPYRAGGIPEPPPAQSIEYATALASAIEQQGGARMPIVEAMRGRNFLSAIGKEGDILDRLDEAARSAGLPDETIAAIRQRVIPTPTGGDLAAGGGALPPAVPVPDTAALKAEFDRLAAAFRAASPEQRPALMQPMKDAAAAYNAAREAEIGTAAFRKEGTDQMGTGIANALAPLKKAFGVAEDAAGGGGFGLLPPRLGSTLAGAGVGTGVGGLAGGGLGLATGHRGDQLRQDIAAGAGLGALAGGSVGSVAPEIAQAAPQVARQLAAATRGTMLSPAMYARGWRAGLAAQAEAAKATGPRGLGGFVKALPAQWRSSVVMTFKQLPQDAITRWVTLWGIAKKELGVADPDIARWQETIASQRGAGTPLDTPVERALRALGQDRLATPAGIHEVYGTDFLSAEAARRRLPMNRGQGAAAGAIFSAFNGLRQVNPLAVAAGAVKGRYQPFINGFVGFMNGVQHDAFRYAMAEKTLQRDIPPLSQALIADLGARGVDVAPLVAKGDYFSGADVARVAGAAVGDRWATLVEETIRNGGDRVAFLAGDFRDKAMLPGEKALSAVFPFVRWPLHYGPVFAEVAANHPRLAAVAAQTLANQRAQAQAAGSRAYEAATTPITTETTVLGALARARLGGQKGVLRAGLLGAVVPYANLAGGIDMPPDDANPYQKATAVGDAIGFSPNPLIQAGAYVTGLDYRAPGALSRTAGLEGAAGLLPGPLGRLSVPAPGAALDALREQITGQSSEYDPVMRRYAELVLARTGQELAADANAPYLAFATPEAVALYDQAKREVLTAGAVGNLASVTSPVSLAARSAEGETIRQAKATVPYSADLIARMSPDLAATMQAVNARYLASVPATRAYRGASPSAREALLLGDIAAPGTLAGALDPLARRQIQETARAEIRRTQPR